MAHERTAQQSIKTKNKLYKRFKRNQTVFNRSAYNEHKRQLNREMRNAEKDHYHELLERYKSDSKKTWRVIRDVVKGKTKQSLNEEFIITGDSVSDPNRISEAFNTFFINVWSNC
jgi:histidinol phosphatase-like enzyme